MPMLNAFFLIIWLFPILQVHAATYFRIQKPMTWNQALKACNDGGGNLASIRSDEDQAAVAKLSAVGQNEWGCNGFWLGGGVVENTKGVPYVWLADKAVVTYRQGWADYAGCEGDTYPWCIRIDFLGRWDDIGCNHQIEGAICEYFSPTTISSLSSTTSSMNVSENKPTFATITEAATEPTTPALKPPSKPGSWLDAFSGVQLPPDIKIPLNLSGGIVPPVQFPVNLSKVEPPVKRPSFPFPKLNLKEPYLVSEPGVLIQEMFRSGMAPETSLPAIPSSLIMRYCPKFQASRTSPENENGLPTLVGTTFGIEHVVEFADLAETITVSAFMILRWNLTSCDTTDWMSTLKQLVSNGDANRVYLSSLDDIWLPVYRFTTSSDDEFMKSNKYGRDLLTTITVDIPSRLVTLDFYYCRMGLFTARCPTDLTIFPFDSATCEFSFGMTISEQQVQFFDPAVLCHFENRTTEWEVIACNYSEVGTMRYHGVTASTVTFSISLNRHPAYYIANFAIPNMVLFCLELATFLLSANEPDRPTFSVTALVAIAFALSSLIGEVPHDSDNVLLIDFLLSLSWISVFITLYHLAACCLTGKRSRYAPRLKRKVNVFKFKLMLITAVDLVVFTASLLGFVALVIFAVLKVQSHRNMHAQ